MGAQDYLSEIGAALRHAPLAEITRVTDALYAAYCEGRAIYVFGNGASAALASHMATDVGKLMSLDLGEGPVARRHNRLRIMSLNDNTAWMTALGNDLSNEDVFLEQLKNFLSTGDVVIAISGSGGSPNVLRALTYARASGALCIGFTGGQPKAALMAAATDICVRAPLPMMEQIEDLHVIYHQIIARELFDRVRSRSTTRQTI